MGVMKTLATRRMLGENVNRFLQGNEPMSEPMPPIRVQIDAKGLQRFTDFTFDPHGGTMAIQADGGEARKWIGPPEEADGHSWISTNPPITIGQEQTLGWLFQDGLMLDIADDGTITVSKD